MSAGARAQSPEPRPGTQTEAVLRLAREGMGWREISARLGADPDYVGTLMFKLRQRGLLAPSDKSWSDEELEALRVAIGQKRLSGAEAAARLSETFGRRFTKNMVIGKATRLGIKLQGGAGKGRAAPLKSAPSRSAQSRPAQTHVAQTRPSPARRADALPPTSTAGGGHSQIRQPPARCESRDSWTPRRVTLLELRDGLCRYPLGDPGATSFAFCGAPAPIDKPYCPHCTGVAYDSPAERAALRKAWRAARGLPAEGATA